MKRDLDSLLYSIALARSIKKEKDTISELMIISSPGGMKNAADKVVKLVKLMYNPLAFDIP